MQPPGRGPYLERGLRLGQGSLQSFLDVGERVGLPDHLIQLMAELRFPKFNIIDTFSQVFGAFSLGFLCLLIFILNQAGGIDSQTFRVASGSLRVFVVGQIGPVPVIGGVPGKEGASVGNERKHLAGGLPLGALGEGSQSWVDGSCFIVRFGHPGEAEALRQGVVRKAVLVA